MDFDLSYFCSPKGIPLELQVSSTGIFSIFGNKLSHWSNNTASKGLCWRISFLDCAHCWVLLCSLKKTFLILNQQAWRGNLLFIQFSGNWSYKPNQQVPPRFHTKYIGQMLIPIFQRWDIDEPISNFYLVSKSQFLRPASRRTGTAGSGVGDDTSHKSQSRIKFKGKCWMLNLRLFRLFRLVSN